MEAKREPQQCVDLLIVGGGINGAGIARDAAGRGMSVTLVEQDDLAAATSSASTKLIHGGLRYLEFFDFRLVRESLIERERLRQLAPHLIHPLQFIVPHARHLRPRWQIRAGLFIYDYLAPGGMPRSTSIRFAGSEHATVLRDAYRHGFSYWDCSVDDSRLVIANALGAAEAGARIMTRTQFLGAEPRERHWVAQCRDLVAQQDFEVLARAIVNAAGPWVERVLRSVPEVRTRSHIRLVKGSHIVVPALYAGAHAYLLQHQDGRIVFTIPYEGRYTLIGTTDVVHDADPAHPRITEAEIEYLCVTVGEYFRQPPQPRDVQWTYAGVRPLLDDHARSASRVTRDYRLELLEAAGAPLLNVFGGKLTTYRRLSESSVDRLQTRLGGFGAPWTAHAPLPGGELPDRDFDAAVRAACATWPFLEPKVAYRLTRAYGTRLAQMIGSAQRMEDLGQQYGNGLTSRELEYLRRNEWARTAEDVLWRRTKLGLHLPLSQQEHVARSFATLAD